MNTDTYKLKKKYNIELLESDEEFRYINKSKDVYVSNYGRFYKCPFIDKRGNYQNARWLEVRYNDSKDRLDITIPLKDGQSRIFCAAQLVADYFLESNNNFKFIDYKDNDSTNIYVNNLFYKSKHRHRNPIDISNISDEPKIDKRRKEYKPKKVPYYNQPIWYAILSPIGFFPSTLEDAANHFNISIKDILDCVNNSDKCGYIDNIGSFRSPNLEDCKHRVYFTLINPYEKKNLKYELHGQ